MTPAIESQLNKAPSTSAPPKKLSERLKTAAKTSFIGRQKEMSIVLDAIESEEPPFFVAYVHGPGGIGKSRFIHAAMDRINPAINRYIMDCRQIEPTPKGFQLALEAALKVEESEPDFETVVNCLTGKEQRSVLALDTYETFGLMDTWLRQEFLPSLTENVFIIIAGREAPNSAWVTTPGWSELFREIRLGELSEEDALRMLESRGLEPAQIERVKKFTHGFPLALEMAAAAINTQPDLEITGGPPPKILQQLTDAFLAGLPAEIIDAVEAASTVRRITEPLLGTLLKISDVREIYKNLRTLPFIEAAAEGLVFQDVVRETISKELERRDPERYRKLRRRAYSYLTKQSHRAAANTLWQYTADLLYLIENPIARGAFFPEGASELRVEPASANIFDDIHKIIDSNETEACGYWLKRWLNNHPETFNVARSPDGRVDAFYFAYEPEKVTHALLNEDPFTSSWLRHLIEDPLATGERALFLRRYLDRKTGEMPSAAVGACYLDIKRTYMELRPGLRRVYTAVRDWDALEPIFTPLGFAPLKKFDVTIDDLTFRTVMNDFGPSSIDGWLARLIGAELGITSDEAQDLKPAKWSGIMDGRRLLTVLFTDIVGSTHKAVELGDRRWQELLENHHRVVRQKLEEYQGHEVDTAGDGFFAVFDKPASAVRCASSVSKAVADLGIQIRSGLHLGECEITEDAVRGITVHIGARVASKAKPGEILVSSTLKEAIAGSDIHFEVCGAFELKGIPGKWNLFAVK
jgi:class 3 adenylate cyclase